MMTNIKAFTLGVLYRCGLHIERVNRGGELVGRPRRELGESYQLLYELGIRPKTVIDIGAAGGTPELMAAFPDARLVLVEPLTEFADELDQIAQTRPSIVVQAAAGAT